MYAGVSRTLNVTYLRPVPLGEKVVIVSEVVSAGKRLCVLKGTMRRGDESGEVLAICEHGKVSVDPVVPKM
jgi:acyl-coenzyme A thioesterase 13